MKELGTEDQAPKIMKELGTEDKAKISAVPISSFQNYLLTAEFPYIFLTGILENSCQALY